MSAASAPYTINLSSVLSNNEQQTIVDLLALLPVAAIAEGQPATADTAKDIDIDSEASIKSTSTILLKKLVDGRGLACPMPLLKTKVALRDVAIGEALYVIATDPNSQADITAFCQQSQTNNADSLKLVVNTVTNSKTGPLTDTIFHFIITKTDSN